MIKLTTVSYNNQISLTPLSAVFGRDGGTLGRSEENYFVLPDPKNLVSRVQAAVKSDGSRHTITNLSQASPVLLNGKEIAFNQEHVLNAGDELQIGLYVLRAEPHLVAVDGSSGGAQQDWPAVSFPVTPDIRAVPLKPLPTIAEVPEVPRDREPSIPVPVRSIPNLAELHQRKNEASGLRAKQSADKNL